jgi:hypothetical protein
MQWLMDQYDQYLDFLLSKGLVGAMQYVLGPPDPSLEGYAYDAMETGFEAQFFKLYARANVFVTQNFPEVKNGQGAYGDGSFTVPGVTWSQTGFSEPQMDYLKRFGIFGAPDLYLKWGVKLVQQQPVLVSRPRIYEHTTISRVKPASKD